MDNRNRGSARERKVRSRLHSLIREGELLRASLITLRRRCGKPTCHCSTGEKHPSLAVEQSKDGKTRLRTVPAERRAEIEGWIRSWYEVRGLLEELSEIQWEKLETPKRS